MVDKTRPLKMESPTGGGTQLDMFPTEMDPNEDYAALKGIAFENSDSYRIEKIAKNLLCNFPDASAKVTYTVGGEIDYVEYFDGLVQTTPNRIIRVDIAYDGNLNPTTETWKYYDTDGTTILRTITLTHSWSGVDYIDTGYATT